MLGSVVYLDAQEEAEMEFGEHTADSAIAVRFRVDSSRQFPACSLPVPSWGPSLSFVLSSDLHLDVLSSDLSILSFHALVI